MKKENLAQILTYFGGIPFIFATIALSFEYNFIFKINLHVFLVTYAAIILSFLAGIHFSYGVMQEKYQNYLLVFSNLIALASWAILMNYSNNFIFIALVILYLLALKIDYYLNKINVIPSWFWNLRVKISAIVIICLFWQFVRNF